jgi:flagella basal body P-ring formation protein FlgA
VKALVRAAVAILALLAPLSAAAEEQQALPTVRVAEQASVRGAAITIADIASVEAADGGIAAELGRLRLGVSPLPGSWREMERELIADQLARGGFGPSRVRLVCPHVVRIFRESQTVARDLLESRLRDFIAANAPWDPGELEIGSIAGIGDVVVPAGELTISIQPRGTAAYLGPMPFSVKIEVDGREAASLVMQARISVFREAVVTTTAIPVNSLVEPSDVELRRVDISAANGKCFAALDEVVGMATTAYLQAGTVVTARTLTAPLLVHRGEAVQLIASRTGFAIRINGIAQQDGRRGEVIRVMNPSTRKIIEAQVTGPQRARVLF